MTEAWRALDEADYITGAPIYLTAKFCCIPDSQPEDNDRDNYQQTNALFFIAHVNK